MSRSRRILAMVTGSIAVLIFGFVVAVAAGSLPGGDGEPGLEVTFRGDLDPTPVLAWVLLVLAVVGLVLYVMGLRRRGPRKERGKRGLLVVLFGVVVFALVLNWVRPMVEPWLEETPPSPANTIIDVAGEGAEPGDGARTVGWLFAMLVAGVVAACLTAIGLTATRAGPLPRPAGDHVDEPPPTTSPSRRVAPPSGNDPRSRILTAYEQFESALAVAGHRRVETETTRRHATRVAARLDLDRSQVDDLVGLHASARYGRSEPETAAAGSAESLSAALRERIPE